MIVYAVRLDFYDLLVLINGQFEDILRSISGLHVAQGAKINPAQQLAGFEVGGIALNNVLGFEHGIPNASCLGIELGQTGGQVLRSGVSVNGLTVFLNGFVGQFAASVDRYLLFVHMGQGVVVIRGGAVSLAWVRRGWLFGGLRRLGC